MREPQPYEGAESMDNECQSAGGAGVGSGCEPYAPPKVESVLTSEQLEREVLYAGQPGGTTICDRHLKENFAPVESSEILEKLAGLRIEKWNYKGENASIRHVGPMAQDFASAFGVGEDDRRIHPVDAFGVGFAAIQALERGERTHRGQLASLRERVAALEAANRELRERLLLLESTSGGEPGRHPEAKPQRDS
jgi:hypothetical protein